MGNWSFDITRQADWDVWCWVCIAASIVLLSYAALGHLWRSVRGWVALALIAVGVGGTAAVLGLGPLRTARAGMIWTFLLLAILSATFYLKLVDRLGSRRSAVLFALRVLALLALVPMLFEPVLRFVKVPKPERPVLFVVDTSGSMSFPDIQNGPTRVQSVWQALQPQLGRIRENFVPQFFTFSTSLNELKSPAELEKARADGKSTDVVAAVTQAYAKTTREDAVVVLMSDGIDNTSSNVPGALAALNRRVHTVTVGSDAAEAATIANIAVADVQSDEDFAVGHESQVTATIQSAALANRVIDVKMGQVDPAGKPIGTPASVKLVLQPTPEGQKVKLPYTPDRVGVHRLAVWVDPVAGERSIVDNRQEFQGLAVDPGIKVLYIEGRLRPEYRDLKRVLERDPNIELATLLRVQQTKFVAFGTTDRKPMSPRIPASAEEWKKFDVVILGDLDASFLSQPQQAAIEQMVSSGKALLMLGGQNSLGPGGYKGTPIEKLLPVFVGDLRSAQEEDKFIPRITPEGIAHPTMEGLSPWFGAADKPGEKPLPPLNGNVVVGPEKAGAQVLLIHKDRPGPDGKPQIVLAVQRYGKGRSAALTVHSTYQWALPLYGMGQDSPYNRLWGQLVRWLAGADVRSRQRGPGIDGLLNKNLFALGENVRVRAQVRDERGDATEFAQVTLKLKAKDAKDEQSLSLNPVAATRGMYDLTIPHPPKGEYAATMIASKDGKELGRQALSFTVIPPADEMLKIAADPTLMRAVANETRGSSYDLGKLPDLIEELIRTDTRPKAQQVSVRLGNYVLSTAALFGSHPEWDRKYDLPLQALLVVPLLAAEWILRRRWQLA